MIITAHIFETEEDCIDAIALINQHLGLPDQFHITHSQPIYNNEKWLIQADDNSISILGQPIEFEFIENKFNEFEDKL